MTDKTHDATRRSWVASANGHRDFPIQNLPFGVVSPTDGPPRCAVAIGDAALDLAACRAAGAIELPEWVAGDALNPFLAMPSARRRDLRAQIAAFLDVANAPRPELLLTAFGAHLPARIGDYTDFFAGIHHATNTGRLFRPDNPLLPNYKHLPVAYHGRASSVRVSGADVRRPTGQRKPASQAEPDAGPSRNLDFELELGVWIGPGNADGRPIPIGEAGAHAAGFCLLNDWSARDVQGWEYQPLGPFLAKSFRTTISPWIVTAEALAPFRIAQPPRPEGDPRPLAYLMDDADQVEGAFDIGLAVLIQTARMRAAGQSPHAISHSNARHLYWTTAQMIAHHTMGGCDLRPGDLFGSGTISAPDPSGLGSLLEMSEGGRRPITLPSGEQRRFLEDDDAIILRAHATRDGFVSIGFGDCAGVVSPGNNS